MAILSRMASAARNLLHRDRVERDLDEELRAHLELLTHERMAGGMPFDQAMRSARMEMGVEQVKERVRDVRAGALVEQFVADLRHSIRLLRRSRVFSTVAILTLALGIGATTTIFSVAYGVLLRPLPYFEPDRLLELREVSAQGNSMSFADPNFEDVRTQAHSLASAAEYGRWVAPVSGGSEPTRTAVARVSRDFFPLLGVQPVFGRGFAPVDHQHGASAVALVSQVYWQQHLGGTNDLARLTLTVDREPVSVVGVLPAGFGFPRGAEIWLPREQLERYPSRTAHNWHVLARLRDGVSLEQARTELTTIASRLKQQYGSDTMMVDVAAIPLQDALTSRARPALLVLLGAVAFLLLIACANVVNLRLAQAAARERELATRIALGAERSRLVRQFLTEALSLALAAGGLGVILATWGVRMLVALAPPDLPRLEEVAINIPVLLFALALSLLVAAGLGVLTALRAPTGNVRRGLAEGSRGETGAARAQRVGRVMIGAQLAITLVLLVGAGLLGRSLWHLLSVHPGFTTNHVATIDLALAPTEQGDDAARRVWLLNELFSRLRRIPGVQEVGGTSALPLSQAFFADGTYILMNAHDTVPQTMQEMERLWRDATRTGEADYVVASEGYFHALRIPLRRGRLFTDGDTMDTPHVALISESLAREKFANAEPLGRLIEFGNMDGDPRPLTVVGVVGDVRSSSLEARVRPTIYVNCRQRPQATSQFTLVLRTEGAPESMISAARHTLRAIDPTLPASFSTLSQVFSSSLESRRFNLILVSVFAGTALFLAMAGIYGITTYSLAQRTREIGLRMALGASMAAVVRLILSQALLPVLVGLIAGVAGSLALTRMLNSMLFGLSATDPVTFAGVTGLLATVTLVAAFVPARRATRIDPLVALRYE